jgi:hypothetical protein
MTATDCWMYAIGPTARPITVMPVPTMIKEE